MTLVAEKLNLSIWIIIKCNKKQQYLETSNTLCKSNSRERINQFKVQKVVLFEIEFAGIIFNSLDDKTE